MKIEMKESAKKAVRIAGGVVVVLALAGLGGLAYHNAQINDELLQSISAKDQEIARLKQDVQKAVGDAATVEKGIKALTEQVQKVEAEKLELSAKLEALEAQVASFDALKKKYKIKE